MRITAFREERTIDGEGNTKDSQTSMHLKTVDNREKMEEHPHPMFDASSIPEESPYDKFFENWWEKHKDSEPGLDQHVAHSSLNRMIVCLKTVTGSYDHCLEWMLLLNYGDAMFAYNVCNAVMTELPEDRVVGDHFSHVLPVPCHPSKSQVEQMKEALKEHWLSAHNDVRGKKRLPDLLVWIAHITDKSPMYILNSMGPNPNLYLLHRCQEMVRSLIIRQDLHKLLRGVGEL